ncbi:MAG: hypothetical protein K2L41_01740 [Muribaculaceae bacterium]|nr:hypothetical protein [Muribaculaceae bacterium]
MRFHVFFTVFPESMTFGSTDNMAPLCILSFQLGILAKESFELSFGYIYTLTLFNKLSKELCDIFHRYSSL